MHTISKIKLAILLISFSLYSCGTSDTPVPETKEKGEKIEGKVEGTIEEKEETIEEKEENEEEVENSKEEKIEVLKTSTKKEEISEDAESKKVEMDTVLQVNEPSETIVVKKNWLETGAFINTDIGKKLSLDYKGDLMNDAALEVAFQKNKKCGGENCGKIVHLHNYNTEKKIRIAVEIKWKKEKETIRIRREYVVFPNSAVSVGCTTDCSNSANQKINWKIIGAEYSN